MDAEEALLKSGSDQTSPEIVAAMLRFQVAWLKEAGRNDEAVAAIRRLIRLDAGDPDSLIELVHWLNEQKAWEAVDELAARHSQHLASTPMFGYALAESQALRGNKEQAEKLAAEALALNPGKEDNALNSHLITAFQLRRLGLFAWATRECRRVIDALPPRHPVRLRVAITYLAEMQHDQLEDLAAAETLRKAIEEVGAGRPAGTPLPHFSDDVRTLGEVRRR